MIDNFLNLFYSVLIDNLLSNYLDDFDCWDLDLNLNDFLDHFWNLNNFLNCLNNWDYFLNFDFNNLWNIFNMIDNLSSISVLY
jgi:hypothetical protein